MDSCIFCKIVKGEIPAKKVYEDDNCLAFYDINPKAKCHVLLIPKKHVASLFEVDGLSRDEMAALLLAAKKIAESLGLKDGFRFGSNAGRHACQVVEHLHFHILGGEQMRESMV